MKRLLAFFGRLLGKTKKLVPQIPADVIAWYDKIGGTKTIFTFIDSAAGFKRLDQEARRIYARKALQNFIKNRWSLELPDSIANMLIEMAILATKPDRFP
jgi:hypothetical protein